MNKTLWVATNAFFLSLKTSVSQQSEASIQAQCFESVGRRLD